MSYRFNGRAVLITGGGRGIGAATAKAFARNGASVMVADVNDEAAEAVAREIREEDGIAKSCAVDATVERDVERMVNDTVSAFGGLHIAVNLVGINHQEATGPDLHKQTLRGWDAVIAGSLTSTFLSCKYELQQMITHGGGSIVNTSSAAGLRYAGLGGAAYSTAKAGIIQFTKFLAVAYADKNVRINCIAPGATVTPAYPAAAAANYPDLPPDEALRRFIERAVSYQAIRRPIECDEQASAIMWLSSEEALMVTGLVMCVDGGQAVL